MQKYFLLALVFLSLSFSVCTGEASASVPAVVGDDGGLVHIQVKLIDGSGNIYLTTYPQTGVSTQVSADQAVFAGFKSAGKNLEECDVLVKIYGDNIAGYVEGPSAGNAMAVLTYAAASQKKVREDATITGAVDLSGSILPVGGLFEKAKASAKLGYKYIVTPVNRFAEKIILKGIENDYGLTVVEVQNVDEAVEFLVNGNPIPEKDLKATYKEFPQISEYETEGLGEFRNVAMNLIKYENVTLQKLDAVDSDFQEVRDYFTYDINRQVYLLEKGYVFTAANEAFLGYIDLSTIINVKELNLDGKSNEIKSCLQRLPQTKKTKSNMEWTIGADLREEWAKQRLNKVENSDSHLTEERYILFNDLMYADAWCRVAEELHANSDKNNQSEVDEAKWKEMAEGRIRQAEAVNTTNQDWRERIENAKSLYEKGKYGAAIYEATFVIDMVTSDLITANTDVGERVADLANTKRTSLWGRIYQTQGVYLHKQGDLVNAYRILKYSESLDLATEEMKGILSKESKNDGTDAAQLKDGEILYFALFGLALFAVGIAIAAVFWKMKGMEKKRSYKKYK